MLPFQAKIAIAASLALVLAPGALASHELCAIPDPGLPVGTCGLGIEPEVPDPGAVGVPEAPDLPSDPGLPGLPADPGLPGLPADPGLPGLPADPVGAVGPCLLTETGGAVCIVDHSGDGVPDGAVLWMPASFSDSGVSVGIAPSAAAALDPTGAGPLDGEATLAGGAGADGADHVAAVAFLSFDQAAQAGAGAGSSAASASAAGLAALGSAGAAAGGSTPGGPVMVLLQGWPVDTDGDGLPDRASLRVAHVNPAASLDESLALPPA